MPLDVWGRSWAGPERGSEILCVLTHGMGSTPPPPPDRCDGMLRSVIMNQLKLVDSLGDKLALHAWSLTTCATVT